MLNESFTERLNRMIYLTQIKHNDFYFCVAFKTIDEATKYKMMYPNKEIIIYGAYLYDNADDALSPQKLSLVISE